MHTLGGSGFADQVVVPAIGVAGDALIAVDVLGFASGFGADPQIDVAAETTIVAQDSNPPPLGSVGSPNVVGAPARSLRQSNSLAVRVILRCAWAMRAPGLAQFIQSGLTVVMEVDFSDPVTRRAYLEELRSDRLADRIEAEARALRQELPEANCATERCPKQNRPLYAPASRL
jgi:hypothetical protein